MEIIQLNEPTGEHIGREVLGVDKDVVKQRNKYVAETEAWYCWSPERGGKAVIIAPDGERLAANSSIPFNKHVEKFKNGRRN